MKQLRGFVESLVGSFSVEIYQWKMSVSVISHGGRQLNGIAVL